MLAGLLLGPLVPPVQSRPTLHARRLVRRYTAGRPLECSAFLAAGTGAPAAPGVLRLNDPGPLYRVRAQGLRQPWRPVTVLHGLGPSALLVDGRAPRQSAYAWALRFDDGTEAVLLLEAPYGPRFARVLQPCR